MEIELNAEIITRLRESGIVTFDKEGYHVDNQRFCWLLEIGLDTLDQAACESENHG